MWIKVGDLNEIKKITDIYKLDEYDYGVKYIGYKDYIKQVPITVWAWGIRVTVQWFYPGGNDARNFYKATAIFTYMTDDPESQTGKFAHWHVNDQYAPYWSNGTPRVNLYIRRKSWYAY